jgi:hypothetical protein
MQYEDEIRCEQEGLKAKTNAKNKQTFSDTNNETSHVSFCQIQIEMVFLALWVRLDRER